MKQVTMREWSNAHEGRNSKVLIAMIISIAHCEYYREILRLTVNHIHMSHDAVSITEEMNPNQ